MVCVIFYGIVKYRENDGVVHLYDKVTICAKCNNTIAICKVEPMGHRNNFKRFHTKSRN